MAGLSRNRAARIVSTSTARNHAIYAGDLVLRDHPALGQRWLESLIWRPPPYRHPAEADIAASGQGQQAPARGLAAALATFVPGAGTP